MLAFKDLLGVCILFNHTCFQEVGVPPDPEGPTQIQGRMGDFDPLRAHRNTRHTPRWIDFRGKAVQASATPAPSAEAIVSNNINVDLGMLKFRDPNYFIAGQVHDYYGEWDKILPTGEEGDAVRAWVKEGVDAEQFFQPFNGKFKGKSYSSEKPEAYMQPNAGSCEQHREFVSKTLEEWVSCGAIKLLGKVGEVSPPLVVMPLTVEASKPRLCHDERFLNLWVRDFPFTLDTLKDVPRLVSEKTYMTSVDHKSGYQHIKLKKSSRKYFGICWQGFYFEYTTLPFGFKASCYVYHTLSTMVASYGRELGVPSLVYLDDSLNTELTSMRDGTKIPEGEGGDKGFARASVAIYIMCELWCRLGYTLSLHKSVLVPSRVLRFLGMLADSVLCAFILPQDKKDSFAKLREDILCKQVVTVKTLQRLQGKCISFTLAVPAARLYVSEMCHAISRGQKNSRHIQVTGPLRDEIEYWRFIDTWLGCSPWRKEKHLQIISLATDASTYKWGAIVGMGKEGAPLEMADYWLEGDTRPIHLKEAEALLVTLQSVGGSIRGHRVDAYVDNMAVIHAWGKQGCRDINLARVIKRVFTVVTDLNVDLSLHYIPSAQNPADLPSRTINWSDARLGEEAWKEVEGCFGPHSIDLMATDANVMTREGVPLRHFTPYPTPQSAGVNVFAQDLAKEISPYCYPPVCLIGPILSYLKEAGTKKCTIVVPSSFPRPSWWPALQKLVVGSQVLGRRGQKGVIWVPTKQGYIRDSFGLRWDLTAFDIRF